MPPIVEVAAFSQMMRDIHAEWIKSPASYPVTLFRELDLETVQLMRRLGRMRSDPEILQEICRTRSGVAGYVLRDGTPEIVQQLRSFDGIGPATRYLAKIGFTEIWAYEIALDWWAVVNEISGEVACDVDEWALLDSLAKRGLRMLGMPENLESLRGLVDEVSSKEPWRSATWPPFTANTIQRGLHYATRRLAKS